TLVLAACSLPIFNTAAYSLEATSAPQSVTMEYELIPNHPEEFINYMFWAIEARCLITSTDESDTLFVEALSKKGKVDDVPLKQGETLMLSVHPGQILKLNADAGAKVRLTNLGENPVMAICTM
ncbi:MAG: hypothetical protein WC627_07600, partial [Legionella sp.]